MKAAVDFASWGPADYVKIPIMLPAWKVVDVGPGRHPHPRADVYVDRNPEMLEPLKDAGKTTILASLEEGLPEIPDGAFDFAFCSHVLEHILEVQKAADTLARIAKRGTIVMPSVYKDALFCFEEDEHLWNVLPNPTHGEPPIFVERNPGYINRLRDQLVQKATCFLYRTGTQHDCTAERHMRAWYQQHEPDMDIVYHWKDELKLQVIR